MAVSLFSSSNTAATVPAVVYIPLGSTKVTFPIATVDDGIVGADKNVAITAEVTTYSGAVLTQGAASADLIVANADGPALSVAFPNTALLKGDAITGTITRNTDTSSALIVNFASSDPTKATVPQSVVIASGQTSASFIVTTIDDHIPDGLQHVQITASAADFASAIVSLGITDVDLPDLVVTNVSAPASGYDNTPLNISWTVSNAGLYRAAGSWLDQVYLDPAGGPGTRPLSIPSRLAAS